MRNTRELSPTENVLETQLILTSLHGFIVRAPDCVYVLSLMLPLTVLYKQGSDIVDLYRAKSYVCFF